GLHTVSREHPLTSSASQLCDPQFQLGRLAALHQIVEFAAVVRKRASASISLGGKLAITFGIMNPEGGVRNAHRSEQGFSVASHGDALFLGRTRGYLFRLSIGKLMPPEVKLAAAVRAEVHPLAVRLPSPGIAR